MLTTHELRDEKGILIANLNEITANQLIIGCTGNKVKNDKFVFTEDQKMGGPGLEVFLWKGSYIQRKK